jgi:hypothetical protein
VDYARRRVVEVPVRELWNDTRLVPAERTRDELTETEIRELLRTGAVQFVHAEFVGPLRWVPSEERFDFWKQAVQPS